MIQSLATEINSQPVSSVWHPKAKEREVSSSASLHWRDKLTVYKLPLVIHRAQSSLRSVLPRQGHEHRPGPHPSTPAPLHLLGLKEGQEVDSGIG